MISKFTIDAQRLTTAGKDAQVRASTQKRLARLRTGFDEMLTVVQDEQKSLRAQILVQRFDGIVLAALAQAEDRKDGLRDECRVCDRCQLREPDAVGELRQTFHAHLQTQARLAR